MQWIALSTFWITRACQLLTVIQTGQNLGALLLGISPENIRNQSFIKSPHSFISRKSTKKLTLEGACLRYKSWSAGKFHFQKLLSTKKKIDEASPSSHLNVLRMTSTAPLYSAIVYWFYKTNEKKKKNIAIKEMSSDEYLSLKLYKKKRER